MPRADPAPATTQSGGRRPHSSPGPPALRPQTARTNPYLRASTRRRSSEWSSNRPDTKSCCRVWECLGPGRSPPPTARAISGPEQQRINFRIVNLTRPVLSTNIPFVAKRLSNGRQQLLQHCSNNKTGPVNYPSVEGNPSRVADHRRVFGAGIVHVETADRRPHLHSHAVAHKNCFRPGNGGMEEKDESQHFK